MPLIKGTASVADSRALSKALKSTKFPDSFKTKVDVTRVNRVVLTQWIEQRITAILGFEDEIVQSTAVNLFLPELPVDGAASSSTVLEVDPRRAQIDMAGFLGEEESQTFARELWEMMIDAQSTPLGIPGRLLEEKKKELAQAAKARMESVPIMRPPPPPPEQQQQELQPAIEVPTRKDEIPSVVRPLEEAPRYRNDSPRRHSRPVSPQRGENRSSRRSSERAMGMGRDNRWGTCNHDHYYADGRMDDRRGSRYREGPSPYGYPQDQYEDVDHFGRRRRPHLDDDRRPDFSRGPPPPPPPGWRNNSYNPVDSHTGRYRNYRRYDGSRNRDPRTEDHGSSRPNYSPYDDRRFEDRRGRHSRSRSRSSTSRSRSRAHDSSSTSQSSSTRDRPGRRYSSSSVSSSGSTTSASSSSSVTSRGTSSPDRT